MFIGDVENLWLIVYIALWLFTIWYYWKKEKYFSANILILCSYLGYAIISLICYNISFPEYKGLTLLPFIFLYIMIMIALRPVSLYCGRKVRYIVKPNDRAITLFLIVFAAGSVIAMISSLSNIRSGIFKILTDVAAGQDIYDETMIGASAIGNGTTLSNIPIVFANVFADVGILLTFYYISKPRYNKIFALLLVLAIFSPFFQTIAESQRGPAIDRVYSIAVSYFLFRPHLPSGIKRIARIGGLALVSFLVIIMAAITVSRFGQQSDERATESVYEYVGMENLNFNLYAFDNNGLRYGDRTAPIFKKMLGFSNVPSNYTQRRAKYPHLRIDDYVFIGFVGDFLLDYGPFFSFIFFVFFSFLFCRKTLPHNGCISLHKLLLVQFAACVCMCGGMKLFSFADLGNLKIIAVFMAYLYLKYTSNNKIKKVEV